MKTNLDAFAEKHFAATVERIGVRAVTRRIDLGIALLVLVKIASDMFDWICNHHAETLLRTLFILPLSYFIGKRLGAIRLRKKNPQPAQRMASPRLPMKYVFCFLLPKKTREPLIGDMEEEYREIMEEFGERTAKLWFYKQVLALLWPTLQIVGRTLTKWGLFGWLEEFLRRIAH